METTRMSAPRPAATESRSERADTSAGKAGAALGVGDFSALLSGLGTEPAGLLAAALTGLSEAVSGSSEVLDTGELKGREAGLQDLLPGELAWLDMGSLVGQTRRLDQAADTALRNGSAVAADDGSLSALPGMQARPMGETWQTTQATEAAALPAQGMEQRQVDRRFGAGRHGETTLAPAADSTTDASTASIHSAGGRFAVAAGMEAAPAPGLQTVLSQIGNWASGALAGGRSEPGAGTAAIGAAGGVAEAGAGSDLAAAPQELGDSTAADLAAAAEEPLVEDMNYWLNARTQRAELVLDRGGQPVRVQVTVTGNEAQVHFSSDQVQTRELLDASLSQLRDLLGQQGLVLSGASVQADAGSAWSQGAQADTSGEAGGRKGMQQARIEVTESAAAGGVGRRPAGRLDVFA